MNGIVGSAMLKTALRRASGVVGASHSLLATLRRRFPSEMGARPSTVIGTGVDIAKFSPALRADNRVRDASPPVILYVGRLAEKKGIEYLLTAMASRPLASLPASLVILGDGALRGRLNALAAELKLGNRVRFLPSVSHEELGYHMAAADILCVPSVVAESGDQEGRPTVLVEAAACGVPAVASDVGGIREWIDNGYNGILVPQADPLALARALTGLLTRPERLRQMGEAARQKAIETTWSAVADRYAEFTLRAMERPLE
jgi:glycosyltransferase involved in cell wall biosynthesis